MNERAFRTIGLTEAHVQETVTAFLALDGWRAFKMEAVSDTGFVGRVMQKIHKHGVLRAFAPLVLQVLRSCMRAAGVGEPGMPDYVFIRYGMVKPSIPCMCSLEDGCVCAQILWIEMKRPGEKPRPNQLAWHETERARGAVVMVVDDIDKFRDWYKNSSLNRRIH
jgi:hypothetical protein